MPKKCPHLPLIISRSFSFKGAPLAVLVNNPTTYGLRFTSHRMESPGTIPEEWKPGAPVTAQFFAAPPPKQSRARDRSGGGCILALLLPGTGPGPLPPPPPATAAGGSAVHGVQRPVVATQHYYGLMVEAGFDDVTCTTTPFAPTAGTAEEDAEEENGEDPEGGSVRSSSGSGSGSGSSSSSSSSGSGSGRPNGTSSGGEWQATAARLLGCCPADDAGSRGSGRFVAADAPERTVGSALLIVGRRRRSDGVGQGHGGGGGGGGAVPSTSTSPSTARNATHHRKQCQ